MVLPAGPFYRTKCAQGSAKTSRVSQLSGNFIIHPSAFVFGVLRAGLFANCTPVLALQINPVELCLALPT